MTGGFPAGLPTDVPVEIGRDEAREAAARELSEGIYHQDDPSIVERGLEWLQRTIEQALDSVAGIAPGGQLGLLVLVGLLVLAVIAIRLRLGRLARSRRRSLALFDDRPAGAAEHRRAADTHAASGAWAEAVRERLRAIIRDLEERALIEVRAGQTADEAAIAGGRALPSCASELRDAARLFDEVWYGRRPATAQMDRELRAVDDAVRAARPALTQAAR